MAQKLTSTVLALNLDVLEDRNSFMVEVIRTYTSPNGLGYRDWRPIPGQIIRPKIPKDREGTYRVLAILSEDEASFIEGLRFLDNSNQGRELVGLLQDLCSKILHAPRIDQLDASRSSSED